MSDANKGGWAAALFIITAWILLGILIRPEFFGL